MRQHRGVSLIAPVANRVPPVTWTLWPALRAAPPPQQGLSFARAPAGGELLRPASRAHRQRDWLCTQLLRASSLLYGVQEPSIFVRSAGWGGFSSAAGSSPGPLREDRMGPGLYRPQPDDRLVRLLRTLRPDQILNRAASFALTPGSVPRLHSPTLVTGRVTCQRTGRRGAAVRGPGYILITHRAGEVIGRRGITSRQAGGLRPPGRLSCRSEEDGAGRRL